MFLLNHPSAVPINPDKTLEYLMRPTIVNIAINMKKLWLNRVEFGLKLRYYDYLLETLERLYKIRC